METIKTIEDLKSNLELVEMYLSEGTDKERQDINKLISGGFCFVVYKINNEYRFVPSRYIGYYDNDLERHNNNNKKGDETNFAISRLVKNPKNKLKKLIKDEFLDIKYLEYCKGLGIKPHDKKRKYWLFDFKREEFASNVNTDEGFPEGKIVERKHKARERNSKLVKDAKRLFREANNGLYCQICGFNFEKSFGEIGKDFIEAHHTIPVSEMEETHKTKIEEIAIVCSNCHRMLHRKRPWLKINDLKKIRRRDN